MVTKEQKRKKKTKKLKLLYKKGERFNVPDSMEREKTALNTTSCRNNATLTCHN